MTITICVAAFAGAWLGANGVTLSDVSDVALYLWDKMRGRT